MFHYALNKGGIMLLGGSESPGELSAEFDVVHERARIYRKLRAVRLPSEFRAPINQQSGGELHVSAVGSPASSRRSQNEQQTLHDQILNRFMPPSLLIDENRSLIDSFGGAETFLRLRARTVRLCKDGRQLHVSLPVSPVYDSQNELIGISKIARDVSERISMENEIRDQVQQREAFLATLSHELRNPLGAALNASRLIRDERTDEETRIQAAEIVERQIAMTRTLLVDLLDMSRISQGKIELKREHVDLCELIENVQETVQSDVNRHARQLVWSVPDHPLIVIGDATRLIQVQVNLISNAAKYSPNDTDVRVSIAREGDWAVIAVTDQGAGLAPDQLDRIFDPFIQVSETQGQSDGGLGVGLTSVKALVEEQGGRAEASSDGLGKGSTFRVCLPVAKVPSLDPADPAKRDSLGKSKTTQSRTIVLIEDIDDSREMLTSLLSLEGHVIYAQPDGESGGEAIARHLPDIALVDIGLPGIDGYEVARRTRQDPGCRRTTLIALTGFGQERDIETALAAGFDAHLVKPIEPEQLSRLIERPPRGALLN